MRLIGESGEQLGVVPLTEALRIARESNTDLVEVAPTADPPVCRLMDYGKFKFEQSKKDRDSRKHQRQVEVRQVRMRPVTDVHDIAIKTRVTEKLLSEGHKVKIEVRFRGREMSHPEVAKAVLEQVATALSEVAHVEASPVLSGRSMSILLSPSPPKTVKEKRESS